MEFLPLFFAEYMWQQQSTVFYFCNLKLETSENFLKPGFVGPYRARSRDSEGLARAISAGNVAQSC